MAAARKKAATRAKAKSKAKAKAKTKAKTKAKIKAKPRTKPSARSGRGAAGRKSAARKSAAKKVTGKKAAGKKAAAGSRAKSTPKAKAKARPKVKPKTKAKAKAKTKTKVKARPTPKAGAKAGARRKAGARPPAASKPKARPKTPAAGPSSAKPAAPKPAAARPAAPGTARSKAPAPSAPAQRTARPAEKPEAAKPAPKPTPKPASPAAGTSAAGAPAPRPAPAGSGSGLRPARSGSKTVVLFPEAAFGPALNCVGIAQKLKEMGHNPVFVCDKGFKGVFEKYGFEENLVDMSGGMSDEDIAKFWANFIAGHLPHFRLSPIEQIPTYVVPVWEAIVDSAILAEEGLAAHLQRIKPDVTCVDNVILFPAIKRTGRPWIRIISCSENEVPDPDIPPHLSGCHENDKECFRAYEEAFLRAIEPTHIRYNDFLRKMGEEPYPQGVFFETSPWMNLLLYPQPLQFKRRHPLAPNRFQYLEGCVRDEGRYTVPDFPGRGDEPLIYVSSGSLGAADVELYKRMIALFGKLPYRFLMNVGDYKDQYADVPDNVRLESWYPQPAVIPHVDLFIHHGGNNSFNEALYFGKPALIMPFCWDGLDNAARIHDTGYGEQLPRYTWTDDELSGAIERLLGDTAMHERLANVSRRMQAARGADKAAEIIARIASKS